ncbi:MAG: MarR family transcriptional regulator [Agathobacter sp.]|nr:MarR family transcriptional regulator [Agathobacter sp.]
MLYEEVMNSDLVEFGNMAPQQFLIGLLSAFNNRYQASADRFFKEITWKQFFAIICINLCKESPTLKELAEIMGSSHQNVKQILLKLESRNFVKLIPDEKDKRKQRIVLTDKCFEFCNQNHEDSQQKINLLFEGISEEQIWTTIKTIIMMERNVEKL